MVHAACCFIRAARVCAEWCVCLPVCAEWCVYFLGVLGWACGAQGPSVCADANECTEGMPDGHVKTSVVPRARIHDIHVVHMQKTLVPRLRPLLLVCAVKVCAV